VPQKNYKSFFRCNRPPIVGVLLLYFLSHQLWQMIELLDIRFKKPMKFLFILGQILIQVATYFEIWSLYVYHVHPHVLSLTMPPPFPHNRVQNKHVKIFHRFRVLYLCAVQRVLKTHWDSRRLDWTWLGRCEHPLTLESDWIGLDSTQLCWCVHTLIVSNSSSVQAEFCHLFT